jgi:predicted ArsR family transcriptional regulator
MICDPYKGMEILVMGGVMFCMDFIPTPFQRIIRELHAKGQMTIAELHDILGMSVATLRMDLKKLKRFGMVKESVSVSKGKGYAARYFRLWFQPITREVAKEEV